MLNLHCDKCGKYMGEVRDAKLRTGMVVYCAPCNELLRKPASPASIPDFMSGLFSKKNPGAT
jgi:phage FluMu protein Com